MAGILEQLQSREAILLMYLGGELPAGDKARVEQMLADDASLRAELEQLRSLQDAVAGALESAEPPLPEAADEAIIRRTLRAMRQHQLVLASRPAPEIFVEPSWHVPRWAQPVIGVAAAIIIVIGLWGFGVINLPMETQIVEGPVHSFPTDDDEESGGVMMAGIDAAELEASFTDDLTIGLDEARLHSAELEAVSEEASVPLF